MMNIFEYDDYVKFLQAWVQSHPKRGRGILQIWSKDLGVHSTLVSQIMNGKKEISFELADRLGQVLKLSEIEADYFLLLVQFSRAGSESLKKRLKKKIKQEQHRSKVVGERLQSTQEISDVDKAHFYSSWLYSGIRNLSAIPNYRSTESLAQHLGLPREIVQNAVEFLLKTGLCIIQDGELFYGPQRTHLNSTSPLANQHHKNWRLLGIEKMLLKKESDLFFTFPMSLSKADAEKIRKIIPKWIEEIDAIVAPSPSQAANCINIDFFGF